MLALLGYSFYEEASSMRAPRAGALSASAAVLSAWSYGSLYGMEHRSADVGEVELALAVRNEDAMCAREICAEQHRLAARHVLRDTARRVGICRVLPDVGEADAHIGNA